LHNTVKLKTEKKKFKRDIKGNVKGEGRKNNCEIKVGV